MKDELNKLLRYVGDEHVTLERHDGGLQPAIGVQSIQVLRANRENPDEAEGTGWTYNHAPMIAYFRGVFYLEYLSNPYGEHRPPGQTLLVTSLDGRNWTRPKVVFPVYRIPDGLFKNNEKTLPDGTDAVMHQRMGFFASSNDRLLILGNYGICPTVHQVPFDDFSIGRVVREILPNGTFGPIFFIRYNVGTIWNEENTHYPFYRESDDPGLIEACDELLASPLHTQQWAEEQGDDDELITVKSSDGGAFHNKAFCWYELPDETIVGLWKWMKCAFSHDKGRTWSPVAETQGIRHAGAKIWGQRTSDGRYALVYNPHTYNLFRWPLAIVTSDDGLTYDRMLSVIGDLTLRRYDGGPYKSHGFHYVRGMVVGVDDTPAGALFVAYSVNKEDIWISRIPVPVAEKTQQSVKDDFFTMDTQPWVPGWNVYSPKWAPVEIVAAPQSNGNCLRLSDFDPVDYARAERVFPCGTQVSCRFDICTGQNDHGCLYVELLDRYGNPAFNLIFDEDGQIKITHGRRRIAIAEYQSDRWYQVVLDADAGRSVFDVALDGERMGSTEVQQYQGQRTGMRGWFFAGTAMTLERISFRTGPVRRFPIPEPDGNPTADLDGAGEKVPRADFYLGRVEIISELGNPL